MLIKQLINPDIAQKRTHNVVDILTLQSLNQEPIINCSVTIRPIWFYEQAGVSSMRLTPSGLTRYFVPDKILPLKSKSFMQYPDKRVVLIARIVEKTGHIRWNTVS
jgi:hypothetical protein